MPSRGRPRGPGRWPRMGATARPGKIGRAGLEPSRGGAARAGLMGRRVMDQHELKTQCLALPGAVEEFPFGGEVSVFKVGGEMFAMFALIGVPLAPCLEF